MTRTNDMTRRDFMAAAAMAVGAAAVGGTSAFAADDRGAFYGPTIRDRLWMWGHHSEMSKRSGGKWPGPTVDQAEGCKLMGIPNNCVIRWGNLPKHPWGDYFDQFRALKRFTFGITDGGNGTVWDKVDWAIKELKPKYPNFTGGYLDDFFALKAYTQTEDTVKKISDRLHENGLRLSIVVYSDQNGIKPEYKPYLDICDETTFWCWSSANLTKHEDMVRRMRDFIGAKKSLLMGVYMWDYTIGKPVPADRMELQLGFASKLLADRTIDGLIFHPSYSAALDVPAVNLAKAWIKANGERKWGV